VERRGIPSSLVAAQPDPGGGRLACLVHPAAAAVVLGSAQPETDLDTERCLDAGLAVARRRGGGGAVVVVPGSQVWLDLFVPVADPLFDPDVGRASAWVGALWRDAIAVASGRRDGLAVHDGRLVATAWSRRVCFSGIGPGEVTRRGRKITGLAQRRDRTGVWFFTMALVRREQHRLALVLAGSDEERPALRAALATETAAAGCAAEDLEVEIGRGLGGAWSAGEDVPAEPHPPEGERDATNRQAGEPVDGLADPREPAAGRHRDGLERGERRDEGDPGRDRDQPVAHRRTR